MLETPPIPNHMSVNCLAPGPILAPGFDGQRSPLLRLNTSSALHALYQLTHIHVPEPRVLGLASEPWPPTPSLGSLVEVQRLLAPPLADLDDVPW